MIFTPKYFKYFVAIVSSIFKNSVSISFFLVYRNAVDFGTLILYPATSINSLSLVFFLQILLDFLQTMMLLDYSSRLKD